jgi:nucleotide-binding universal stress UspA family protein
VIEQVLVPMDDSPLARRALDFALEVHPDADVTVLHVVDHVEESYGAEMLVGPGELRERAEARAERLFEAARERAADHGTGLRTVTRFGEPARVITEYAGEADVDLVVMGCHGREGVTRVLLGDVAQRVVRRAPVPVTVVR